MSKKKVESIKILASIFRQGDRIVYRTNFSFPEVSKLIKPTEVREQKEEPVLEHLLHIENRFKQENHVQSIVEYVEENKHNFILPTITLLTTKRFAVIPVNPTWEELNKNCKEEISPVQLQDSLLSILEKVGTISAFIIIPIDYFEEFDNGHKIITIGDGNHRADTIKKLVESNYEDYKNMYIGVDFYVETNPEERKRMFVALNSSLPVEKSIKSFLMVDDPLSNATKDLIGFQRTTFMIKQLNERDTKKYIGFEALDNVGANSKATLSFNILKNMLGIMTTRSTSSLKFAKMYSNDTDALRKVLLESKQYLEAFFDKVKPFAEVQGNVNIIPQLRKEYISLSGAGLYLIAYVAFESKEKGYNLQKVANILATIDWKREINSETNKLFLGGVLNNNGSVSNTRSAIMPNVETIMEIVHKEYR